MEKLKGVALDIRDCWSKWLIMVCMCVCAPGGGGGGGGRRVKFYNFGNFIHTPE